MNKIDFVFFHVGDDTLYPTLLTKSIKKFNPDSKIFYITDKKSKITQQPTDEYNQTKSHALHLRSEWGDKMPICR
jgi:hypothetical protein